MHGIMAPKAAPHVRARLVPLCRQVAVVGHSQGGTLALMALSDDSALNSEVSVFGA